ncbi:glycosyltransferase family 4 protein [Coleofasciculus chthonoplastes]|uniref:glycosyltransferase family 4 protein n=1 Tax=Coleofasciculus chthonoplastes TaxID=64178 RepID=UPI0033019998
MNEQPIKLIITVVNDISSTSMPLNEFVLYRAKHYPDEKHFLVVFLPVDEETQAIYKTKLAIYNVEVIECQGSLIQFLISIYFLVKAAHQRGQRVLCHLHHSKTALMLIIEWLILANRFKLPKLYTVHNVYDKYSLSNQCGTFFSTLLCDRVSCNSYSSYFALPQIVRDIRKSELNVIYNGIDIMAIDAIVASRETNLSLSSKEVGHQFRLISVNRCVKAKNISFLLKVLQDLPPFTTLTLVGDGVLLPNLKQQAKELKIDDRVFFTGRLSREAVYRKVLQADIYVSSSIWEGLGNAVLEAMALRKPVVLSNIEPYKEIAKKGQGSVKVIDFSIREWTLIIKKLSRESQGTLEELGEANRKIVEDNFTLTKMHEKYSQIYSFSWNQ